MRNILLASVAALGLMVSTASASSTVTNYGTCESYSSGKSISLEMVWVRGTTNLLALNVDHIGMAYKGDTTKSDDGRASITLFANDDEFIYRAAMEGEETFQYVLQFRNNQMWLQQGTSSIFPNVRAKFQCK